MNRLIETDALLVDSFDIKNLNISAFYLDRSSITVTVGGAPYRMGPSV